MAWNPFATSDDPSDPIARAYFRLRKRLRNVLLIATAVGICIVVFGIPSVQWNYRTYSTKDFPSAMDKINADYWNPVGGWRVVRAGEFSPGCPIIIFIPLRHCMDLAPYKNRFTTFVLGEEFFDET